MPTHETTAAVLYADVSSSMTLFQALGDARAREVIRALFEGMLAHVREQEGRIVKDMGDGLMCAFPTAERAALAALAMQRYASEAGTEPPVMVHIGFHWGPVIPEGEDLFGHTVNLAARVTDQARPDRILTTRECREQLPQELRSATFPFRAAALKGVENTIELYELIWRSDGTELDERGPPKSPPGKEAPVRLKLSVQGREYVLEPGQPSLTIGRSETNGVVIADKKVSGGHARIDLRGGTFVLTDQSRNGTFVAFDGAVEFFKTGRELQLRYSGRLWFGRAPDDPEALCVRFFIG